MIGIGLENVIKREEDKDNQSLQKPHILNWIRRNWSEFVDDGGLLDAEATEEMSEWVCAEFCVSEKIAMDLIKTVADEKTARSSYQVEVFNQGTLIKTLTIEANNAKEAIELAESQIDGVEHIRLTIPDEDGQPVEVVWTGLEFQAKKIVTTTIGPWR